MLLIFLKLETNIELCQNKKEFHFTKHFLHCLFEKLNFNIIIMQTLEVINMFKICLT